MGDFLEKVDMWLTQHSDHISAALILVLFACAAVLAVCVIVMIGLAIAGV